MVINKNFSNNEKAVIKFLSSIGIRNDNIARVFEKIKDKTINNGRISEIKKEDINLATLEDTNKFLAKCNFKIVGKEIQECSNPVNVNINKFDISNLPNESEIIEYKEKIEIKTNNVLKTFAGFANNKGGKIIFGINDKKEIVGVEVANNKIDIASISDVLQRCFEPKIVFNIIEEIQDNKKIIIIEIQQSKSIVICKADNKYSLEKGAIYYRYIGKTEKINYIELNTKINDIVENALNDRLLNQIHQLTQDSVILNTKNKQAINSQGKTLSLEIDDDSIKNLSFIKEGEFNEEKGKPAIKIIAEANQVKLSTNPEETHPYRLKNIIQEGNLNKVIISEKLANILGYKKIPKMSSNFLSKLNTYLDIHNKKEYCTKYLGSKGYSISYIDYIKDYIKNN